MLGGKKTQFSMNEVKTLQTLKPVSIQTPWKTELE